MKVNSKTMTLIKDNRIEVITLFYLLSFLIIGLTLQPTNELIEGLKAILVSTGVLITDYLVIGGLGASLVNASVVTLICYVVLILSKVSFSGISIAALFTVFSFGLFGKNIWSILPIILGVFIYSKLTKQKMRDNVYAALFGTALAPIASQAAFGFGWGLLGGFIIGTMAGILIAPVASHVLKVHEGYNLYNVGFASGIVGLFIMSILRSLGYESEIVLFWATNYDNFFRIFSLLIFISILILGYILDKDNLKNYKKILKSPGTSASDFIDIGGLGNTLINMGLLGIIGMIYIEFVGSNYNGPTVGGLFTLAGFGAYGKHPLNTIPIILGVWLATLFTVYNATDPVVMLAALFGTALAPLAGKFGPLVGILAGMTHLVIVSKTAVLHGGLNLYNNGFSAGFVAIIFLSILKNLKKES